MKDALAVALRRAVRRLEAHSRLVDNDELEICNVDESTFRSFFLEAFVKANRGAICEIEWQKCDCLILKGKVSAVIEFKFYFPSRTLNLDGMSGRWKGGAGLKNEGEFRACVEKMKKFQSADVSHRFVVLAYNPRKQGNIKASFANSYSQLDKFAIATESVTMISNSKRCVCKLINCCEIR